MKIAINGRMLLPHLEGIGHYTYQLLDQLTQQHPEVEFHVILDRGNHDPIFNRQNITRHVLFPPTRHPLLWHYWFEYRLPNLLNKLNADVFFSPDNYLSLKTKTPTLLTIHDLAYMYYPEGTKYSHLLFLKKYMPQFIKRADAIACVSQYTSDHVVANFPTAATKIVTIHNGVTNEFVPLKETQQQIVRDKWTGGRSYFLYLGAIHPRKNIKRLIKAFELYKSKAKQDTVLLLVGRMAWQYDAVKNIITTSEFKESIIHVGHVDETVPELIAAAKAMVYISLFEGFGLPALEALACGIPVITSRNSPMEEVCGDTATYVDPKDITSITTALLSIDSEQNKIKGLVSKRIGRTKDYSWDEAADKVFSVLQSIAK